MLSFRLFPMIQQKRTQLVSYGRTPFQVYTSMCWDSPLKLIAQLSVCFPGIATYGVRGSPSFKALLGLVGPSGSLDRRYLPACPLLLHKMPIFLNPTSPLHLHSQAHTFLGSFSSPWTSLRISVAPCTALTPQDHLLPTPQGTSPDALQTSARKSSPSFTCHLPQNLVTEENMACPTHFLQILFFKTLPLFLFPSSCFLFSPPLLREGLIWAQVEE